MNFSKNVIYALGLPLIVGIFVSCGGKEGPAAVGGKGAQKFAAENSVSIDLEIEADRNSMSEIQVKIYDSVKNEKKVDLTLLRDGLIESYKDFYLEREILAGRASEDINKKIYLGSEKLSLLADAIQGHQGHLTLKPTYTGIIISHNGQDATKDPTANSLFDILEDSKIQSYSGSTLHDLLTRFAYTPKEILESKMAMIYRPGHVHPGRIIEVEGAGTQIQAIETTERGESEIRYEDLCSLKIVDSHYWAIVTILSPYVADTGALAELAVSRTMAKFGLNQCPENVIADNHKTNRPQSISLEFAHDPFAISGEGPIQKNTTREHFGEIDASEYFPSPARVDQLNVATAEEAPMQQSAAPKEIPAIATSTPIDGQDMTHFLTPSTYENTVLAILKELQREFTGYYFLENEKIPVKIEFKTPVLENGIFSIEAHLTGKEKPIRLFAQDPAMIVAYGDVSEYQIEFEYDNQSTNDGQGKVKKEKIIASKQGEAITIREISKKNLFKKISEEEFKKLSSSTQVGTPANLERRIIPPGVYFVPTRDSEHVRTKFSVELIEEDGNLKSCLSWFKTEECRPVIFDPQTNSYDLYRKGKDKNDRRYGSIQMRGQGMVYVYNKKEYPMCRENENQCDFSIFDN